MRVQVLSERPMGDRVKKYLQEIGETLVDENPEILVIAYYPRILKKEEFEKQPTVNFHPGLLPYNRGMYPHIWPLFDGTPGGVTIHYINEKIDEGDIIAQKQLEIKPTYTASDFERITQHEIFELFKKCWPDIKRGIKGKPQTGPSTFHYAKEISSMQEFDRQTMRRLAACTFDDRTYGYFIDESGNKIKVGIKFYE